MKIDNRGMEQFREYIEGHLPNDVSATELRLIWTMGCMELLRQRIQIAKRAQSPFVEAELIRQTEHYAAQFNGLLAAQNMHEMSNRDGPDWLT